MNRNQKSILEGIRLAREECAAAQNAVQQGHQEKAELISRLPVFDPAWPPDLCDRWFDLFNRLMDSPT